MYGMYSGVTARCVNQKVKANLSKCSSHYTLRVFLQTRIYRGP